MAIYYALRPARYNHDLYRLDPCIHFSTTMLLRLIITSVIHGHGHGHCGQPPCLL